MSQLPTYAQLCERSDVPPGSAWKVFGEQDELGTINLLAPEVIKRAAGLVKKGVQFNLDWPINAFDPPIGARRTATHHIFGRDENQRDDYLDNFYLQSTSQIDGLRHQRHPKFGFYNGVADSSVAEGSPTLGVQLWADRAIVGRAVLLDVERHLAKDNRVLDHASGEAISLELLECVAKSEGVDFEDGDILLIHTGWSKYYFESLDYDGRNHVAEQVCSTGIAQSREMLAWLWDRHFSAVASDTVAVEAVPAVANSPFTDSHKHLMHQELIPLLGLCLGELWRLDELADDCASDGIYECMLIAKPLNLVGGVGSPANAVALK